MFGDQLLRKRDHVLRLVAVEPDGLDQLAHLRLAELNHFLRSVGEREQRGRRLVDAGVGRLRRQHDRDQQRERIDVLQFAFRLGFAASKRRNASSTWPWSKAAVSPWRPWRRPLPAPSPA